MDRFLTADRIIVKVIKYISYFSGICLVAIMFVAFFNVLGEKFFHWGIPMSTEIIQYLHIPVVFLACAFVTLDRGQVKIDLLSAHLPVVMGKIFAIFGDLLGLLICAFIAWRGFIQTGNFIDRHSMSSVSGMGFPLWPFGVILSFGFAIFSFSFLWSIFRRFSGRFEEASGDDGLQETEAGAQLDGAAAVLDAVKE
jgi:TRAP-type C4-dicarboxylate transport system permease small subunit